MYRKAHTIPVSSTNVYDSSAQKTTDSGLEDKRASDAKWARTKLETTLQYWDRKTLFGSSYHSLIAVVKQLASQCCIRTRSKGKGEPALCGLLRLTVLACHGDEQRRTLAEAVAHTVCYRLLLKSCGGGGGGGSNGNQTKNDGGDTAAAPPPVFCPHALHQILLDAFDDAETTEHGHTMLEAVAEDVRAVVRRDPAMDTPLQVVLFSKGFAALVCHRAAHRLWRSGAGRYTALFLQSQCSAVFGLDIHPAAVIGMGVLLDHGTGVVIGETAVVGDGCTLLHGVTLGGTGKEHGDRHPKVGRNVLIGANSSVLGNVRIGDESKIGAGSVVLRDIPPRATAVGAPAKIIGRVAEEERPGSDLDETLRNVQRLHKSATVARMALESVEKNGGVVSDVTVTTDEETASEVSSEEGDGVEDQVCPWRHYVALGRDAPPGTVTLCRLRHFLHPLGCTMEEIGGTFFALDTRLVGYVRLDAFREMAPAALSRHTRLDPAAVAEVVDAVVAAAAKKMPAMEETVMTKTIKTAKPAPVDP